MCAVGHFDGAPPATKRCSRRSRNPRELSDAALVATPLVEQYDRLIATVFDAPAGDRATSALRLSIAYPPMNSTAIMRFALRAALSPSSARFGGGAFTKNPATIC